MFDIKEGNKKVDELNNLEAKRIDEIRSTPNMDLTEKKGAKRYVSPNGNDTNCGLTPKAPFKSINRAIAASVPGDTVLLERGGYWREKVVIQTGITLTAYGEGRKPIISGSPENGAGAEKWTLDFEGENGEKIWKFYNEQMTDVGGIFFDGGDDFSYKGYAAKDIPDCCGFDENGAIFTCKGNPEKKYDYRAELKNMHFFHKADSAFNGNFIATDRALGPIYLRCDKGNPGEIFSQIEFNTKGHTIVARATDITIDNICIVHTGSHGIGAGTIEGLTVQNCEIGWIGGSLQSYYRDEIGTAFRFGNGVEIYGGCKRYTIRNCYVYQCYDAGITHQYSFRAKGDCIMDDVLYKDNVITDCVYNIEYFHSEYEGYVRTGKNILFEGNLLRRAGFGFGQTRPNRGGDGNIRSGGVSNPFKNYVIKNNIFDRSITNLVQCETQAEEYIPKMIGNTYIQGVGNGLCRFGVVPVANTKVDENVFNSVKNLLRDEEAEVYFVEHIPQYEFPVYTGEK